MAVGGDISFLQHHWMSTGGVVVYVMEFVASRVRDAATRDLINDMVEAGAAFLHLEDPSQAELVDIIADELPSHVAGLQDAQLRENLTRVFTGLYLFAREQQDYNRDPTQETYLTIGPNPARYFQLENLKSIISDDLKRCDYVRIDVSDYTEEQRAMVREYLAELANPRVFVVGDERLWPGRASARRGAA